MLETPFGKINILGDGVAIQYDTRPFVYIKPPVKDKPIAGCYRIHIPVKNYCSVQCVLELENGMEYRMNTRVDEVVFGIAWATDYEGTDDVRVWFAADPTVYFKM